MVAYVFKPCGVNGIPLGGPGSPIINGRCSCNRSDVNIRQFSDRSYVGFKTPDPATKSKYTEFAAVLDVTHFPTTAFHRLSLFVWAGPAILEVEAAFWRPDYVWI